MKLIYASLAVILGIALFIWEASWRLDRIVQGDLASDGNYVAQFWAMPEGSALPYGQGVYVRHWYNPFWATSTLVFAGYCRPKETLQWLTPNHLLVKCGIAEGAPKSFPPPGNIVVTHDDGGS